MYVDESTAGDYLLMCAVLTSGDVNRSRATMRGLLLPKQRSLHMKDERRRAPQIISTVCQLETHVLMFRVDAGVASMDARRRCVEALAGEACALEVSRVVLDRIDDKTMGRDKSWLIQGSHRAGHGAPPFTYDHLARHEDPLLWIADAVGWAWARGGELRATVAPMVTLIDV